MTQETNGFASPRIEIHLCVPDDEEALLPKRRRAPKYLPMTAPLPRRGEVIYLGSSSVWAVDFVVHQWRSPVDLQIEVWLRHLGTNRPAGFQTTQ